jgi:hypothetical protein
MHTDEEATRKEGVDAKETDRDNQSLLSPSFLHLSSFILPPSSFIRAHLCHPWLVLFLSIGLPELTGHPIRVHLCYPWFPPCFIRMEAKVASQVLASAGVTTLVFPPGAL